MRKWTFPVILLLGLLFGCGVSQKTTAMPENAGDANAFNPWMQNQLPNLRAPSGDGAQMLGALGARAQTIEGEAKHRKYWREELYPIVFGDKKAPNEILVVLDFSNPDSEKAWDAVMSASKSLKAANCKVVVFGHSQENYGTDLMGLTIWLARERPSYAMPWLKYALNRWNAVKDAQKRSGNVKNFTAEFDATASSRDFPIAYSFLTQVKPAIPANQELTIAKYSYNAGNVNMYQATQVCKYYGIHKLPAVIVNGHPLDKITSSAILAELR